MAAASTVSLRVGGMASIFIASCVGSLCCLLLLQHFPRVFKGSPFKIIRSMSAGVIAGVAFIHVLPDAVSNMAKVSDFPWAYIIALFTSFLVLGMEQLVLHKFEVMKSKSSFAAPQQRSLHEVKKVPQRGVALTEIKIDPRSKNEEHKVELDDHPYRGRDEPRVGRLKHSHSHEDFQAEVLSHVIHAQGGKSKVLTAHLLELGIVLHSIIIGIGLGIIVDNAKEIKILTIALCVHQFFEGVSLASCIAQAELPRKAAMVMCLVFSCTTPFGIGVGIGISGSYEAESPIASISEGVLGSAAAGVLIYMSLVTLIAEEWAATHEMIDSPYVKVGMFLGMCFGTLCMSILAIWA